MTWVKLDDRIDQNVKIATAAAAVGDSALAAFVSALAYCNRELTDGFVPVAILRQLTHNRKPQTVADALVDAGLWEPADGGFVVHDYHVFQPSREKVLEDRRKTAKRVRDHRSNRRRNGTGNAVTPLVSTQQVPGPGVKDHSRERNQVDARDTIAEWDRAIAEVRGLVGDRTAGLWLTPLHPHFERGELVVGGPLETVGWVAERLAAAFEKALGRVPVFAECSCHLAVAA